MRHHGVNHCEAAELLDALPVLDGNIGVLILEVTEDFLGLLLNVLLLGLVKLVTLAFAFSAVGLGIFGLESNGGLLVGRIVKENVA